MLQTGAILCHEKMVSKGIDPGYASKLIQYGWETITEALKHGGITGARNSAQFFGAFAARAIRPLTAPALLPAAAGMMDRLDNPSKMKAYELADELKEIMRPLCAARNSHPARNYRRNPAPRH